MTILVVGGAGYIGAHVVRLLVNRGDEVVVVDDLTTGTKQRIGAVPLVSFDIAAGDGRDRLEQVMREYSVHAVINFAAKKRVGESVERPAWYFSQNVAGLANVLQAMEATDAQKLVFSSSAAVYGMPDVTSVDEQTPPAPINPYGQTKLAGEWLVDAAATAWGMRGVNLRYFNVAGAGWPDLGDPAALNLVTMVFERMDAGHDPLIFGDDYPTADGTCVRDYVHVLDLAEAHIAALDYLERDERPHSTFNVGTGSGASVREVINEISRASSRELNPEVVPRRAGDPPQLIADATRIQTTLGWGASRGLTEIIRSAWEAHEARHTG